MKKTLSFIIISFFIFHFSFSPARAQNLYIGSFYVTSTTEESSYGDGGNKWTNRMPVICDMFNFEQPDVLGLQSLTEAQIGQISKRMTSYKFAGDILYNKELNLDTCGIVSEMPEGSTCSWVRLQKNGSPFYVFNICFSTEITVATSSSTRIRTAIGEINAENLPVFIVGFLGVNETKTAYSRIISRYNDCFTQAASRSAEYGTVNNFDLTANHSDDRYDFVFTSKNVSVQAYGQLQYGYFTKESDGNMKRRLPSTHFPVMAKVKLP
ncbi:MAG: hypothetical protein K6G92_07040 [Bacteroidaceae bacterium]|nr:hypothetical protein [Bacteroidaceae bacterium]